MADLPSDFPKWRTVHHYFALWSTKPEDGSSLLEQALTKSGRRSPAQTGTQRQDELLHRCCTALEALEQNKKHLAAGFGKIPNASLISVYNLST